ncbi:MAG TPA: class I SAM-dependent methyltransferase [Chitinophagales bacterium]|nr:class I SAM-dependent methyltransferase [Chitinophagales bacterium]
MNNNIIKIFCPVCIRDTGHRLLLKAKKFEHNLYACQECELRRLYPIPESYIMQGMYEDIATAYDNSKAEYSLRSAEFYLREINKLNSIKRKTLLDIGCGLGYYSNAFGKIGLDVTVVEPDKVSYEFCEKHQKKIKRIIKVPLENYLKNAADTYDIIYCRHVIEHLNTPLETLKDLRNVCHDDTIIILETDNNDSTEMLEHPESKRYWGKYYIKNYHTKSLDEVKHLHVTALGIKNTHYYAYNRNNLSKFFNNIGFQVITCSDYHLGNKFLWPNVPDYSSNKVFFRLPKYLLYLGEVMQYRKRINKIQGAGLIFFAKPLAENKFT